MRIINLSKNTLLAEDALVAEAWLRRAIGLLGRKEMQKNIALVIRPCQAIHTFFMRFSIDVIFVNRKNEIIGLETDFKPWRMSKIYWQAKFAVELPAGRISKSRSSEGDIIGLLS